VLVGADDDGPIGWIREIVLDSADPWSLARFWAGLLGGTPVGWYPGWVTLEPPPHGQRLSFQGTAGSGGGCPAGSGSGGPVVHFDVLVGLRSGAQPVVVAPVEALWWLRVAGQLGDGHVERCPLARAVVDVRDQCDVTHARQPVAYLPERLPRSARVEKPSTPGHGPFTSGRVASRCCGHRAQGSGCPAAFSWPTLGQWLGQ
jgi:hypothetical protein